MTREWATSVAHAAVLAVVLSLLWQFAAPVTPFDPFTADLGDAPTASISILGYQHAFTTLGPAWLPSSLLIFVACIASFIGTMLLIRNADRHRVASPPARAMAVRWWHMAVSAIIGLSVAAVAAISPPQSRGFGVVDPSSIQARMEDSVLFRESIGIFAFLCFAASLLVALLFAALPDRWRPRFPHA